jgi:hypothetical protein
LPQEIYPRWQRGKFCYFIHFISGCYHRFDECSLTLIINASRGLFKQHGLVVVGGIFVDVICSTHFVSDKIDKVFIHWFLYPTSFWGAVGAGGGGLGRGFGRLVNGSITGLIDDVIIILWCFANTLPTYRVLVVGLPQVEHKRHRRDYAWTRLLPTPLTLQYRVSQRQELFDSTWREVVCQRQKLMVAAI